MPSDTESKAASLARIRENQRRCRARRREYVAELEQRIRTYEQRGIEATMEVQATAQKVARENELLRRLLRSVGFDDKFQDEYIRSELQELTSEGAQVAVSPAQPPDLPGLECEERAMANEPLTVDTSNFRTSEIFQPDNCPLISLSDQFLTAPDIANLGNTQTPVDPNPALQLTSDPDISQSQLPSQTPLQEPEHAPYFFPSFLNNMRFDLPEDGSMLCSMAYKLIMQYNRKGYDDLQLNIKLRKGFKKGRTPLEGCRVENKVLFSVLAEIS